MWHSDRPLPQQRLAVSLSHLLLPLPRDLFIPFLHAFWTTMAREWSAIDVLRLDKFLRLVRCYVNVSCTYLAARGWDEALVQEYVNLIENVPLSVESEHAPDGLRYHVMDVWVEELDQVDAGREDSCPVDTLMGPLRKLEKVGQSKVVRQRAREALSDQRLEHWSHPKQTEGLQGAVVVEESEGRVQVSQDDDWEGLSD